MLPALKHRSELDSLAPSMSLWYWIAFGVIYIFGKKTFPFSCTCGEYIRSLFGVKLMPRKFWFLFSTRKILQHWFCNCYTYFKSTEYGSLSQGRVLLLLDQISKHEIPLPQLTIACTCSFGLDTYGMPAVTNLKYHFHLPFVIQQRNICRIVFPFEYFDVKTQVFVYMHYLAHECSDNIFPLDVICGRYQFHTELLSSLSFLSGHNNRSSTSFSRQKLCFLLIVEKFLVFTLNLLPGNQLSRHAV